VGTYATYLIDGLANIGHSVTVVCTEDSKTERNTDVRFFTLDKLAVDPTPNAWLSLSYKFSGILRKIIKMERFDIVHYTDARESLFPSNNERALKIGTVHDFYSAIAPKNLLWYRRYYPSDWIKRFLYYNLNKLLESYALPRLDGLISVCGYTLRQLNEKYGVPMSKFHIVYNGIDVDKYNKIHDQYKHERELRHDPLILFVGGNFQRKNLSLIIKSSPDVIRELPNAQFCVVGKDSTAERHMRNLTRRLGVENNFKFLGYIEKDTLHRLYVKSDVFVMPSLYESFAFVFLEALASGTPIIGGKVGGAAELINHGENGFLIDPYDCKSLAQYILILLQCKGLWKNMSINCRKTVEKFTAKDMVKKTVEVYRNAMERGAH